MAYTLMLTESVVILVDQYGNVTTGGAGGTGTVEYEVPYEPGNYMALSLTDPVTRLNHWYWWVWEGENHNIAGASVSGTMKRYSASIKLVYTWVGAPDAPIVTRIDTTKATLPVDDIFGWQFGKEGDNVGEHTHGGELTDLEECTWYWVTSLDPSHHYLGDEDDETPQPIVIYVGASSARQDTGSTSLIEYISCSPPSDDDYSVGDWKYIDFPDCGGLASALGNACMAGAAAGFGGSSAWGGSYVWSGLQSGSAAIGIKHGLQADGWIQPDTTMWYKVVQASASAKRGAFRFVVPTESQIISGWGGVLPSNTHKYWFKTKCEEEPENRGIYGLPKNCEDIAGQNKQLMVSTNE